MAVKCCVPYTRWLRKLQAGGHQLGPPTAPGLYHICWTSAAPGSTRGDWQLLLSLPNCKALLQTSTAWDCKARRHKYSVDTAFTSKLMIQHSKSFCGNIQALQLSLTGAPHYSFGFKIIPIIWFTQQHYLENIVWTLKSNMGIKGPVRTDVSN